MAVVLAGMVLRYFYLQQQLRLQEQAGVAVAAGFAALQNPASLPVQYAQQYRQPYHVPARAAEQAVEDLSELFRVSLQENQRPTTVADELRLCELYLGIEQLRLGERLQVQWQVDAAAREQPMPSLMLQPLVENAIYHGMSQLPAGRYHPCRGEPGRQGAIEVSR